MRTKLSSAFLLTLLLVGIFGCTDNTKQKVDVYENSNPAQFVDSICVPYKTIDDSAINLNIYYLKNDTTTDRPALVYIHGGNWIHGNKSWIWNHYRQAVLEGFIKSHYVVISIDYRLTTHDGYSIFAELEDCRDALSWVKMHASEYNYDAERIGLWGTSAGAHLSLLLGSRMANSIPIRYVIDDYGPTDIDKLLRTDISPVTLFFGRIFKPELLRKRNTMMEVFRGKETELSPINVINKNMPPVMISHGSDDDIVPLSQAYDLVECLKQKGIAHRLTVYPGEKHILSTLSNREVELHVSKVISFADSCNVLVKQN